MHRSAVLARGNTILPKDLPEEINSVYPSESFSKEAGKNLSSIVTNTSDSVINFEALYSDLCQLSDGKDILKKLELELIKQAMEASNGVVVKAAKVLGMTASTLKKRIAEYEIQ